MVSFTIFTASVSKILDTTLYLVITYSFFHFRCLFFHADMGMGFVLKVGDFNEMPNIPFDFPHFGQ